MKIISLTTLYRKPSPEADHKNDGDPVKAGDVVGLIEVMKNFHELNQKHQETG